MEVGWSELLIIGVVALVVIGPKDLPEMFRTLGRFTAKMRSMAREFSRAMEDAARESGVKEAADDLRKVANPRSMGLDAVKSAADKFEKWDPLKTARGSTPQTPAGGAVPPTTAAASAAGVGLGSATAAEGGEAAAAVSPSTPLSDANPADFALKRAEREAIAREASERLRLAEKTAAADAFEDAPATVTATAKSILPAVTSAPLDTPAPSAPKKAAPKKAAPKKAAPQKAAAAKTAEKPAAKAVAKPAAKKVAQPKKPGPSAKAKAAEADGTEAAAKPAAKRRSPAKKTSSEAKDQA
ncbi:twin-arginine translocase subunit TatB [Xinfangfangia sp. D13-10-4-6]|uniref:Sec-independent protein translocase protein TatB n=1 Tax=Pseudogemmobacter hezensis TaxID=2737662 RepID=UPI0015525BC5|nr:Sec-independent protein translocase protein TatB [Pseudogemmobacter hezensis]NPD13787.1 twin-arginine translocase subunit TatB [Pseudogemmobacter hezensis]